jgi:hypothetical protein
LGCHPREKREASIRALLGIPEHVGVLSIIAIGRPAVNKPARTQYDQSRDHREQW